MSHGVKKRSLLLLNKAQKSKVGLFSGVPPPKLEQNLDSMSPHFLKIGIRTDNLRL